MRSRKIEQICSSHKLFFDQLELLGSVRAHDRNNHVIGDLLRGTDYVDYVTQLVGRLALTSDQRTRKTFKHISN